MTKQDLFQSVEQRSTLFTQGREVSANATQGGGADETAKAAGNLLLELDPAQVPFSQVLVKGHGQIEHQALHGRHPLLALAERGNESASGLGVLAPQLCRRIVLIRERLPRGCHIAIRVTISAIDILPEQSW